MIKAFALVVSLLGAPELYAGSFDWGALKRQRIELELPLLIVQGEKGLLACGYIDVNTCNKTGEACAIVSGVSNHNDMLSKPVLMVSEAATRLGIEPGMSGSQALEFMR